MLDSETTTSLALLILSLSLLGFFLAGQFYLQPAILQGSSMEPSYPEGYIGFFLRNFDSQNIGIGSVISYEFNKTLWICHRVISKGIDDRGIFYIAKGDNNTVEDPLPARPEQVKGILVFGQPFYLIFVEFCLLQQHCCNSLCV